MLGPDPRIILHPRQWKIGPNRRCAPVLCGLTEIRGSGPSMTGRGCTVATMRIAGSTRRKQTMDVPKRVIVCMFGNPTRIAQALGLDIELPDSDRENPAYWERVHAKGWKPPVGGQD